MCYYDFQNCIFNFFRAVKAALAETMFGLAAVAEFLLISVVVEMIFRH